MSLTVPDGDENLALSYLTLAPEPPPEAEPPPADPLRELVCRIEVLEARLAKIEKRKPR